MTISTQKPTSEEVHSFRSAPLGRQFELTRRLFGFTVEEWSRQIALPPTLIRRLEKSSLWTELDPDFSRDPDLRDQSNARSFKRAAQMVSSLVDLSYSGVNLAHWVHSRHFRMAGSTPFKLAKMGNLFGLHEHIQLSMVERDVDYGPDDRPYKTDGSPPSVPQQSELGS
jgi:hypothetical protein